MKKYFLQEFNDDDQFMIENLYKDYKFDQNKSILSLNMNLNILLECKIINLVLKIFSQLYTTSCIDDKFIQQMFFKYFFMNAFNFVYFLNIKSTETFKNELLNISNSIIIESWLLLRKWININLVFVYFIDYNLLD